MPLRINVLRAGRRLSHRAGRHVVIAIALVALPLNNAGGQDQSPDHKIADPMAGLARMVSGEWRMTAQSGKSMFHTWYWGPGKHSIRRMTDGDGAGGEPWRELQVFYWHPGRQQVRLLGVSPFARGIWEGALKFEGETAAADCDLYQTGQLRRIGIRWAFDGPDKYRDTLLEATGSEGFKPLVELVNVRTKPPASPRSRTVEGAKPSKYLKVFEPLLGHTWEAKGAWAGKPFHIETTFEWLPLADAICMRVLGKDGQHLLDGYFYHHTGANVLHCLTLSTLGGVFEGDVTVLDGGALKLDLKSYEGDVVVPYVVQLDFVKDRGIRQRLWSLKGTERTLLLDVDHKKLEPKKE
jgi:hypothetical protein